MERQESIAEGELESPPEGSHVPAVGPDRARIEDLLVKTSRTFALSIPLLPEPTRWETTLAYLLFRIADTFEDASVRWRREQQITALEEFAELLDEPTSDRVARCADEWHRQRPIEHDGYLELIADAPLVLRAFAELGERPRSIVAHHTRRTADGMAGFVARTGDDGNLQLTDLDDLRQYCYIVAGIVGEMLTELFLLDRPGLAAIGDYLRARARSFGEALQLVNILRDSASDATEGRLYLPVAVGTDEIFELARSDLGAAGEYVRAMQDAGGPDGLVLFTGLPVLLARATLDRVEREGPGAKLTRPEVFAIHEGLHQAVAKGRPAVPA